MTSPDSLLDDLAGLSLTATEWRGVHDELAAIDPDSIDMTKLSQIVFEAKVRQKFHAGRSASSLAPTKQTSALPWVGAACGLLLLVVGTLLGGGAILVGVVALSLGVLGVAVAGSRVAHRRIDAKSDAEIVETRPAPAFVLSTVEELRGRS